MDENKKTNLDLTDRAAKVGKQEIDALLNILKDYREGKHALDQRIRDGEEWWRMRNAEQAAKDGHTNPGFKSKSAWLHNVIQNKHADAMDAFPEPNVLPREANDKAEARMLSSVIPVILEANKFSRTYSKAWYSKLKFGTGVYKVVWDSSKLHGLGDISVLRADLLNVFWEPGVEDIQDSRYFFEVIYQDEDALREEYPKLKDVALPHDLVTDKFPEEQKGKAVTDKVPVVHAYYHKGGKLHLTIFVPGHLLFSTENDPSTLPTVDPVTGAVLDPGRAGLADTGIYDHGRFPYVFDPLFPVEKSPAGFGYVDIGRQPQLEIDLMKSAMVQNTKAGAMPRFLYGNDCGINKGEYLDTNNPLVHFDGTLSELNFRPIEHVPLDGNYLAFLQDTVQELRDTTGNTDAATGTAPSGVTTASGLAALQEASGKTSRDASMTGYDAYQEIVEFVIELVRQFYDAPRTFRITGDMGEEQFVELDNSALQPQPIMGADGMEAGQRLPAFDVKVVPQRKSAYTKMANNDLALEFYGAGFFDPERCDQALACLQMMDFDGRDELIRTIRRNGTLYDLLQQVLQLSAAAAVKNNDAETLMQMQMIMQKTGGMPMTAGMPMQGMPDENAPSAGGVARTEPSFMTKARTAARNAGSPSEGGGMA